MPLAVGIPVLDDVHELVMRQHYLIEPGPLVDVTLGEYLNDLFGAVLVVLNPTARSGAPVDDHPTF
jgi:hypothetical protein